MRTGILAFRALIGIAAGLIGLASVAIGVTVWALRNDALVDAASEVANIATVLAEEGASSVRSIDIVAGEIADEIRRHTNGTPEQTQAFLASEIAYRLLDDRRQRLTQTDFIALVDVNGQLVNTSRLWPSPSTPLADRDYFRHLSTSRDVSLFVSELSINRVSNLPTVFFSKRIEGRAGDFRGVILIGVRASYFEHMYRSIHSVRDQSLALTRTDGTVLVRYPENDVRPQKIIASSPWYRVIAQGGGNYRAPGSSDGVSRLIGVRPLRGYPLAVNVSVTEESALSRWRHRALLIGIGSVFAVFCSVFLLSMLIAHVRRLIASESSLAEREARLTEKSNELVEVNATLDSALHDMPHGLAMFDRDENLVICNERYLQMYNLSGDLVKPGVPLRDILELRRAAGNFSADADEYIANRRIRMARSEAIYIVTHLGDGRVVAVHNRPAKHGGWVAIHEDITERERAEAQMAHMAKHDALTDLANRVLFRERMGEALARLRNDGHGFSVFVFDLDMFKSVNDSLGHPIGDALLKVIAQRLQGLVREGDTICRLGGDEFAVIQLAEGDQKQSAIALAHRLLAAVCAPFQIEGHEIVIGTSIGIALAPIDGTTADELLKNADLALYRAKTDGRKDFRFFESEMDSELRLRRALEVDLRHAFARGEFELHYQPVIDVVTGRADGAEALVRWQHPLRGLIPPDKFIPLAEETGLIVELGEWILKRACADAARWPDCIRLAVNLSPVQFRNANISRAVRDALAESGLPARRLELEITESVLLQDSATTLNILHELKTLGVGIVLDDFGTGYSSLRYLRMFPFDKIKIDRSFIEEMPHRSDCAAIVCAITGLARNLTIETTAEGVETEEQFALLRAAGCTHAQGYLFSRPRPVSDLDFTRHRRGAAA